MADFVCADLPPGVTVARVALDARPLATVRATDPAWAGGAPSPVPRGAIVRALPPADATDARIEQVEDALREAGALRVRTMPRANAEAVVAPRPAPAAPSPGPRAVVMAMAEEARTRDRPALVALLDGAMSAEGL